MSSSSESDSSPTSTPEVSPRDAVALENILTWPEYMDLRRKMGKLAPADDTEDKFQVNEEINAKISLWQGDITKLRIDAIVNAANNRLLGGGGVDGCIHRAAGRGLLEECRTLGGCDDGDSKITNGYKLPAKHVIHTVGPRGEKPLVLKSAYVTSFKLMLSNDLHSIAFPCISTGIFGYPQDNAARVALKTARFFLEKKKDEVDRVIFAVFLPEDLKIYESLMQTYFPTSKAEIPTKQTTPKKEKTPTKQETPTKLENPTKQETPTKEKSPSE